MRKSKLPDAIRLSNKDDDFIVTTINSVVLGGNGDDAITGGDGNDRLYGQNGKDRLAGGDGDDWLYGANGNDKVIGGNGNDRLYGGNGNDKVIGGDGNDRLYGGNANDNVSGGDGNDRLYGQNGKDRLAGGDGNDRLYGGNANDKVIGGDGNDQLFGQNGSDRLYGAAGEDSLYGGNGKDYLFGGAGNDVLIGGNGKDYLSGGVGDDVLIGGNAPDVLYGGDGKDILVGGNGPDDLIGGYGVDVMAGGLGPDRFIWRDADVTSLEEADPSYPQGVITTLEADVATGDAPALDVWVRSAEHGGSVGVTEDYANSGYGSLLLTGDDPSADGGYAASASYSWNPLFGLDKIDVGDASDNTTLSSLTALEYDWYRDSSSTSPDSAIPVVRLLVDLDGDMTTTGDQITLTFDPSGGLPVAEDAWKTTTLDFSDPSAINFSDGAVNVNLADALDGDGAIVTGGTLTGASLIYGVEVGIDATASGSLLGAVDNVTIGFHADTPTSWNFELAPTEPDVIVDFTSNSDKLYLGDLLPGYSDGADINNFVLATTDVFGDTTVSINGDGLGTDWTGVVVLKNATIDLSTDIVV